MQKSWGWAWHELSSAWKLGVCCHRLSCLAREWRQLRRSGITAPDPTRKGTSAWAWSQARSLDACTSCLVMSRHLGTAWRHPGNFQEWADWKEEAIKAKSFHAGWSNTIVLYIPYLPFLTPHPLSAMSLWRQTSRVAITQCCFVFFFFFSQGTTEYI